jgi:hypothetical protein
MSGLLDLIEKVRLEVGNGAADGSFFLLSPTRRRGGPKQAQACDDNGNGSIREGHVFRLV